MRGRVTAVSLVLLFLAFPLFPQCSWAPRYSGQFRTTALDVSTPGDGYLWLATGYGLRLFDITSPGEPELVDSIALPGVTRVVRATNGGLAYAGSGTNVVVVRRDGDSLQFVRSVAAGGTVQDIVVTTHLFAATSAGIAHFDLLDAASPTRTTVVMPSSSPSVTSLAVGGHTLYAADGDATVEQYTIEFGSLPQHIGTIESLPRSSAVHFASGTLYVSDQFGQSTDVISGSTSLARIDRGSTSFAAGPGNVRFLAGADRVLRAADLSSPEKVVDLLVVSLPPADGTDNVIHSMTVTGPTLYVAAGDIGLVVLDAALLASPYPLAGYADGARTSVAATASTGWFTGSSGTISQQRIDASGIALIAERSWNGGDGARVHDVSGEFLLSSSGSSATLWSLTPQTPSASLTVTFPAGVRSAVIRGTGIVALLDDSTVWTASPAIQQLAVPKMAALARAGSAIAFAEAREEEGTVRTVLHYYETGDFGTAARQTKVDGSPVGGVALDATRAALFTFTGVNVVDLATSAVRVIPGSGLTIPLQIALAGGDVLVLADRELFVYANAEELLHRHALPADAVQMAAAAPRVLIATVEGRVAASYLEPLPRAESTGTSTTYRDAVSPDDRLALRSAGRIDLFSTAAGEAPHYLRAIDPTGVKDFAAAGGMLYTLNSTGTLTAYSRAGVEVARRTFEEGPDAEPLSVDGVAGAVWVAFSKDCLSGGCRKETIVVDSLSLTTTATVDGGVVDAVWSGNRAWALFDLPDEVRVYDVTDALHPSQLAAAAAPASARSVSHGAGKALVLGDRVYTFHETTLAASTTHLAAVAPTAAHRIRVEGDCAVVTGRASEPELYDARNWTPLALPASLPSPTRLVLAEDGRLTFLTDHSVEIWTITAPAPPVRRRAVGVD